jgi:hypothetical protein
MDERVEGFLRDVLALEGEHSNLVRESVRAVRFQRIDSFACRVRPKRIGPLR